MDTHRCKICGSMVDRNHDVCLACEKGLLGFDLNPYLMLAAINYVNDEGISHYTKTNHPTQDNCPEQCMAFSSIIAKMWQTHLDKNADYSPANILLTGEPGLVTRLWDKTARLLNLTGFKFKAILSEGYSPPKRPKNESIDDTYMDLSVYGIIGLLLRRGQWGK